MNHQKFWSALLYQYVKTTLYNMMYNNNQQTNYDDIWTNQKQGMSLLLVNSVCTKKMKKSYDRRSIIGISRNM